MAKKKNQINNNGNNDGDGENKQKATGVTVVLKIDLHCEGCAGRVLKAVRTLEGVESVRIGDSELNKLTVIGNLDPVKLREKVEEKTKKKVELISPASKKTDAGDGDDKKKVKQCEKVKPVAVKKEEKKPKELPVTTAVLKVSLHCQGCIRRIHKLVSKTKGYVEMTIDKNNDLVTVKGAFDMKLLANALQSKLRRAVEIVPAKKDGGDGGGDKKGKGGGGGGGGDKKGKGGGGNDGEGKGGGGGGGGEKKGKGGGGDQNGDGKAETYKMESHGGPIVYPYPQYAYGSGYADYVHAPQLFSDENPNACFIM